MARCPNCARKVHFWHNHSGYCSKACRTDSITSCPNCGKVGLYKHARLGCCSEECRYWYVAGLLGYDKDALLTPAWDKIVYHVRLPSTSAEISSLQLDELEYDRAIDTVLVVAAPPWMIRSKVLAELPYERFDNTAWQHLWADGTLTEDELFRFHRMCYDDDLLCQKVGEHVYAKLRQPTGAVAVGANSGALPAISPGYYEGATMPLMGPTRPMELPQARITAPAPAPSEFVASVRAIFEERGYTVTQGVAENTLLLLRHGRTALAAYQHHSGMVDVDPVQRALAAAAAAAATQTFVVTNGHFTLQAEDIASTHPVQLIDGDELAALAARRQEAVGAPTPDNGHALDTRDAQDARDARDIRDAEVTLAPTNHASNGDGRAGHSHSMGRRKSKGKGSNGATEPTEVYPAADIHARDHESRGNSPGISFPGKMAPVDAEIVGGEGTA